MGSEALETLPVVRCPGCEEPMQPKGAAPVTRELDDVNYACPKCGAESRVVFYTGFGKRGYFWSCEKACGYLERTK